MECPPLKQFFSYFGSKGTLSAKYPPPAHGVIIEPFAGAAGYACRYWDRQVHLYDLSPTVVGVWRFLILAKPNDILSLPLKPEDVKYLSQAERDFIGFWWGRCGASPRTCPNAWARSGKYPYSFWSEKTRKRIADQVSAINHWKVEQRSYEEVRNKTATWFIDPHYQMKGQRYPYGSDEMDYVHLGAWVKSRRGQVIACETDGADYLPFTAAFENSTIKYRKVKRTVSERVYLA
jgi:hypothetical protein